MAASVFRLLRWGLTRGPSEVDLAARANKPRLQTIAFSHYCELARWALDAARIDYDEVSHLPGFGFRVAALRGDAHLATTSFPGEAQGMPAAKRRRTGVPALAMPDGAVLRDSWEIAALASSAASAAPTPADAAWERTSTPSSRWPCASLPTTICSAAPRSRTSSARSPAHGARRTRPPAMLVRSMRKRWAWTRARPRPRLRRCATARASSGRVAPHDGSPSTDEMAFAAGTLAPPEYGGTRWCDLDAQGGRASRMLAPREHGGRAQELQPFACETAAGKRTLALRANRLF